MFSGIVEEGAIVTALRKDNDNLHITLKCSFTKDLKIDQSVSHNGVCLTVVDINGEEYTVIQFFLHVWILFLSGHKAKYVHRRRHFIDHRHHRLFPLGHSHAYARPQVSCRLCISMLRHFCPFTLIVGIQTYKCSAQQAAQPVEHRRI